MVKNAGGNKSKKVARKNTSHTGGTQDVRRATDASEMYAAVIKIYSSQRCSVLGADGNTYQMRSLDDGSVHEVLKNFPAPAEVQAAAGPRATDFTWSAWTHYWAAAWTLT